MVLIDTSVWIRFLSDREPRAHAIDRLLANDRVLGHELVQGELLIGDSGSRGVFLENYATIHHARTVPHHEVVDFVRARKLHARGIGWSDAHLLASALVEGCELWTADAHLAELATTLRVAHKPGW